MSGKARKNYIRKRMDRGQEKNEKLISGKKWMRKCQEKNRKISSGKE